MQPEWYNETTLTDLGRELRNELMSKFKDDDEDSWAEIFMKLTPDEQELISFIEEEESDWDDVPESVYNSNDGTPDTIEPLSNKDIKQLAIMTYSGQIYGTWHNNCDMQAFLPLVLMSTEQVATQCIHSSRKKSLHFYEYMDKAGSMSVNGRPSFMSCRQMSQRNWRRIFAYMDEHLFDKEPVEKVAETQG